MDVGLRQRLPGLAVRAASHVFSTKGVFAMLPDDFQIRQRALELAASLHPAETTDAVMIAAERFRAFLAGDAATLGRIIANPAEEPLQMGLAE